MCLNTRVSSWSEVDSLENVNVRFVFIRATVGDDRLDAQFKNNWLGAKKNKLLRGAYHYYRQRKLSRTGGAFIKTVSLNKEIYLSFRY
jgi:lysozyme